MSARSLAAALAAIGLASACAGAPPLRPPPPVEHEGAMRDMFASESAAGRVAIAGFLARPHAFALGPLADLRGELLVWDGTPFTSRVDGGSMRLAVEPGATAPFLVWSHVREWRDSAIPDDALALAAFEAWLPRRARELGLDADRPFAFQVAGAAARAVIHVVDLPEGAQLTREAHDAAKRSFTIERQPVQILGFHAFDAKGVYTHHTTNLHLHLRTPLGGALGHVDELELAPGAVLRLAWR